MITSLFSRKKRDPDAIVDLVAKRGMPTIEKRLASMVSSIPTWNDDAATSGAPAPAPANTNCAPAPAWADDGAEIATPTAAPIVTAAEPATVDATSPEDDEPDTPRGLFGRPPTTPERLAEIAIEKRKREDRAAAMTPKQRAAYRRRRKSAKHRRDRQITCKLNDAEIKAITALQRKLDCSLADFVVMATEALAAQIAEEERAEAAPQVAGEPQ